jgi:hypothetical protein
MALQSRHMLLHPHAHCTFIPIKQVFSHLLLSIVALWHCVIVHEQQQRHGKKKYTFVIPKVGKIFLSIVIAEVIVVVATSAVIIAAQNSTASVAYTCMVLVTTLFLGYFAVQAVCNISRRD